jgi:hypothetical protein
MIVAAHQPHYLPWLGYLHKLACCDLFVVMDDLQYEAQNFQNRNRVKVNNGALWLTVPLVRGSQTERICDKRIDNSVEGKQNWQRRSWETLRTHYGRAPYFNLYAPVLEEIYTRRWDKLLDLDLYILRVMMDWFELRKPVVLASSLELTGQKTERIVDLCQKVKARTYLSGKGGSKGYLELSQFDRAGIHLAWQEFAHPEYPQRYPGIGFVSHLAALDLIFNCGPESKRVLLANQGREDSHEQAI